MRGQRKLQLEFETRRVVTHLDLSPMETGDGGDKAEAEPVAGSAAASFKPVEALEDVLTFIDGNSRPVIGDRNDGTAIVLLTSTVTRPAVTAMFDGVVDEIGHRVEQEVSIARDEHALIPDDIEMPALVFRRGIEQLHDLARDLGQVYGTERGCSIIRLYLRDPRERGEHAKDTRRGPPWCRRSAIWS